MCQNFNYLPCRIPGLCGGTMSMNSFDKAVRVRCFILACLLNFQDMLSRLKRALVGAFPYLHMTWSLLCFSTFLGFLFRYSDVHSPVLKLSSVKLVPLSLSDMMEEPSLPWSHLLLRRYQCFIQFLLASYILSSFC